MKRIGCLFSLMLVFLFWLPDTAKKSLAGEVVLQQIRDLSRASMLMQAEVLWTEWMEHCRKPQPYRNPRRGLIKALRLCARRQRKMARRRMRGQRPGTVLAGTALGQEIESSARAKTQTLPMIRVPLEPVPCTGKRRGPRPKIPTDHLVCSTQGCRGYNKLGPHPDHRIVGAGKSAAKRQMFQCQWCKKRLCQTRGTVFFGLKTSQEIVYRALASLAEGQGLRATARIFEVKVDTLLSWLVKAGQHCEQVSSYLMRNLQIDQVQLDELWTFVRKKEKSLSAWEKLYTLWGDTWIWTAFDPLHKLVLTFYVGEHEQAQAITTLQRLKGVLRERCLPFFTSDELPHYIQAILKVFGCFSKPKRKGSRGRFPNPRLIPTQGLHYASVHKHRKNGRVKSVTTRVIFGKPKELIAKLRALGVKKINTSFVERMNLTLRHLVSRLRRKGLTWSKKRENLVWHLHLSVAYYHFVRPHRSLRRPLPQPLPTNGSGSQKIWQKRTPAMSAGLTDHIWTLQELLTFRVPQIPLARV